MNLKEKAVHAYNEELKVKEEVSLFREKMKECFDVSVEEESKSITLENLKFGLSKSMDHLLVQKICDKCGTIDASSYSVNSLIDLGKFLKEEGETFKHTCTPSSLDISKERPMKQQKHQKEKEEGEWSCPFCNTIIGQKAHVCPSCGYRK
jgi:rubrerythrin